MIRRRGGRRGGYGGRRRDEEGERERERGGEKEVGWWAKMGTRDQAKEKGWEWEEDGERREITLAAMERENGGEGG